MKIFYDHKIFCKQERGGPSKYFIKLSNYLNRTNVDAKIFAGFNQFLRKCHDNNITIYVISHKTIYSNLLQGGTNLREAALLWMEKNIFTNKLSKEQVFFGSTLDEKNKHINILQFTHFIDDLEEVFNASSFPTSVKKILFNSSGENKQISDVQVLQNWEKINNYFFSNRAANIES